MRRVGRRTFRSALFVAGSCAALLPALAPAASAVGSRAGRDAAAKPAKHCRRAHRVPCSGGNTTQTVTGTSGGLTVTFTATENGTSVSFDIASSESQAYGALGPEVISFGDGTSQGFATPEYCLAQPVAESDDRQVSTTYAQAGTYTASVTVGANCTPDQLTLTLPVTVG